MEQSLGTTNLLLGIMAVVSVLEALVLLAVGAGGFLLYRRLTRLVHELEARQVAPAMARVNAILDDVKLVTATVRTEAQRVDDAVHSTINRVDDTVGRVRSSVRTQRSHIVGFIRGVRTALETLLTSRVA